MSSITPIDLYPPHPATTRAQSVSIAYDKAHDRVAYASGRSVFIKPVDPAAKDAQSFQLSKHTAITTAAAFSPSGFYLATGDEAGQVKVWNTPHISGRPEDSLPSVKSEFQILSGPIKSIAWDADNSRIIAVGDGKEKFGHCFTFDTGNSVGEIQGHSDTVNSVDIKPQRPYRAATVGNDKALVFYTGPPFKFDRSVRDYHTNIIRQVKFSPDGKYLVTVGSDRVVVVYDGKTGEFVHKIDNAHEGGIFGVSWYEDSSKFATCSADNTVKVWNVETWDATSTLSVSDDKGTSVVNQLVGIVVTSKYILTVTLGGRLVYLSESESVPVKSLQGHQTAISASVLFGDYLVTGGSDGSLYRWKIEGEKLAAEPESIGDSKSQHSNYVADLLKDGNKLVSIGWDDKLKTWDFDSGIVDSEVQLKSQPKRLVKKGDTVSVVFENGVESYADSTLENEQKFKYDTNDIDVISERLVATNLNDNKLESVDGSGTVFESIRGTPCLVRASPDGQYIALGDTTGKYTVYNADGTVKTTRWVFHTSRVNDASWSPDSKFLLSAGLDCGILIYSVDKLSKVTKIALAHQTGITKVEWVSYDFESSGTAVVATTGLDGAVKLWKVDLKGYK